MAEINEILVLLAGDEKHEAEEQLSALLGLTSIGVENGDHADAHEEGDEHSTDDHEADAAHEEGDEHSTDEPAT